ncbi:hypothetical protein MNV49_006201 [Pseudohyphozyma bogoriensis]|nr:hypothetical protein MNV49_006201 [Pseudohyphozyma bogoriensis]
MSTIPAVQTTQTLSMWAPQFTQFEIAAISVPFPSAYEQSQIPFTFSGAPTAQPTATIGGTAATAGLSGFNLSTSFTGINYGQGGKPSGIGGFPIWAVATIAACAGVALLVLALALWAYCRWKKRVRMRRASRGVITGEKMGAAKIDKMKKEHARKSTTAANKLQRADSRRATFAKRNEIPLVPTSTMTTQRAQSHLSFVSPPASPFPLMRPPPLRAPDDAGSMYSYSYSDNENTNHLSDSGSVAPIWKRGGGGSNRSSMSDPERRRSTSRQKGKAGASMLALMSTVPADNEPRPGEGVAMGEAVGSEEDSVNASPGKGGRAKVMYDVRGRPGRGRHSESSGNNSLSSTPVPERLVVVNPSPATDSDGPPSASDQKPRKKKGSKGAPPPVGRKSSKRVSSTAAATLPREVADSSLSMATPEPGIPLQSPLSSLMSNPLEAEEEEMSEEQELEMERSLVPDKVSPRKHFSSWGMASEAFVRGAHSNESAAEVEQWEDAEGMSGSENDADDEDFEDAGEEVGGQKAREEEGEERVVFHGPTSK